MSDLIQRKIHRASPHVARPIIRGAIIFCSALLGWGADVAADGFDLRNLNMAEYSYPDSEIIDERHDQYDAKLVLLSRDSADQVVQFYKDMGLQEGSGPEDGWGGVVVPGSIVFEKHMVADHVPLYVTVFTDGGRGHNLDDRDLYFELEKYVYLGKHTNDELQAVRQRFDVLKERFYKGKPTDIIEECKAPTTDALTQKGQSMEERGRRLQELAKQGRMDELLKESRDFGRGQQALAGDASKDRWAEEIGCLEELESESYLIKIELTASRDDVAG